MVKTLLKADGITESWIQFETGVGPRLWPHAPEGRPESGTLLTTMRELKGHEEAVGLRPSEWGQKHGRRTATEKRGRKNARRRKLPNSAPRVSPIGVIVWWRSWAGIALGARLRQLNVPTIIIEKKKTKGLRQAGASVTSHSACMIRFGIDHLPYLPFPPETGRFFSPKRQDRGLARNVCQGDGA